MYQKYTTDAFLVWSRGSGEADRNLLFLTRDFGMILAHATSIRHSKSKLRPHIAIGAPLTITLLRSKSRWKITEACPPLAEAAGDGRRTIAAGDKLSSTSAGYKIFAQILTVLKSLVHGEERNEALFGAVSELHAFLYENPNVDNLDAVECLAMIKILYALGYGEPAEGMIREEGFNQDTFQKIRAHKKELVEGINKALEASGL